MNQTIKQKRLLNFAARVREAAENFEAWATKRARAQEIAKATMDKKEGVRTFNTTWSRS